MSAKKKSNTREDLFNALDKETCEKILNDLGNALNNSVSCLYERGFRPAAIASAMGYIVTIFMSQFYSQIIDITEESVVRDDG